jgi:hypothetical protein
MINFNNSLAFIISAIFLTTYLNRKKEIIKLIKNPKWFINLLIIIFFCIYSIEFKRDHSADTLRLQGAIRKGILAFIIAILAHLELTIAPFWIVFALAYYSEGYV